MSRLVPVTTHLIGRHGLNRHVCHVCDTSESFSSETMSVKPLKVVKGLQLGCGVALAQDREVLWLPITEEIAAQEKVASMLEQANYSYTYRHVALLCCADG